MSLAQTKFWTHKARLRGEISTHSIIYGMDDFIPIV